MKYQILIELLFLLLSKDKVTVSYVMRKFEISRSTVFRYMDALSLSKIPVVASVGRNGGFFIPKEYKINYGFFTKDELSCLLTLLKSLDKSNLNKEQFDLISSIIQKLSAVR